MLQETPTQWNMDSVDRFPPPDEKFFVLAIAAFVYIAIFKKMISKPALFGCLGLYFLYTFIEMRSVMKMSKKPNA